MYLKNKDFKGKVYVIGKAGITAELENIGLDYICDKVSKVHRHTIHRFHIPFGRHAFIHTIGH